MNTKRAPDTKQGAYYVTVIDGQRVGRLAGPFIDDHASALAMVDRAKSVAMEVDCRAFWYAYGTCRVDTPVGPGVLNDRLGI